jgi:alpha-ketoglutarate-dependent taurine dioxygenase
VIAFLCVRQAANGGANFLANAIAVHNEILRHRPDLLSTLYHHYYWKRHNVDTGNEKPWCQLPIFAPYKDRLTANCMRVLIERADALPELPSMTPKQREALDMLEQVARDPDIHMRLRQEPGDLLFINNFAVLHSREAFQDPPGLPVAQRRLLLRLWLSIPNNRPLPPAYASLYGYAEAGALRGGIWPAGARPAPSG